ncbi:putative Zn-dependent peptidase [Kordia periserrulae]|uniref:Putative Zn-dependent peptidase n=1 Tax=Kordia periserrulae TaxID=701523 RepID=A0A2T6BVC1_9FLAO|nr:insulinase family protein [Kordia periserrulae]PTX60024.1 putative Zn-dependent peptidase [Kordia periserrulae]
MKTKIVSLLVLFVASLTMQAQIDRSKQPKPGPAPKVNIGKPDTFTLKNGLTVMVVENNKLPRVSATLRIDNPLIVEGEKAGMTDLVSSLLGSGSMSISKDDFNEEVDYLGASLNFGSQSAFASSLSKYFPRIMELMADAALNPNFTQEDLESERAKILEGIKSEKKNVSAIAGRVQSVLAYGPNHPYGEFVTEETIKNVTLDDIKAFHNKYFRPNNAYLIVIGDVKTKDVKKLVKKLFKNWEQGTIVADTYDTASNPTQTEINFINADNAVQSELSVQNTVNLTMKDEDYFPVLIANNILGGGGEARLFNNLREDKKFTYGSYSSIGNNRKTISRFSATASVRNAVTDSAVVEILKEIKKMTTELVSDEELKNVKAKYVGRFVTGIERPSTIANYALNIITEDLPKDFYETYLEKIEAVTKEDVLRAAKKYFKKDNLRIVVTGKGSEVIDGLENITFEGKKVPVKYYDQYGNSTKKPVFKKPIPAGVTAQTVVNDYIKAIGGKEKLMSVNSIVQEMGTSFQGMDMSMMMKRKSPNLLMVDVSVAGMGSVNKQVFDGETGYISGQGQKMDMPAEMIADMKSRKGLFPELYYESDKITLKGIESVDGKDAYAVVIEKSNGEKVTNFYDTKTGLKVKESSTGKGPGGQEMIQDRFFSDYKEIDGVMIPHGMVIPAAGQKLEMTALSTKINTPLTKEDFQ